MRMVRHAITLAAAAWLCTGHAVLAQGTYPLTEQGYGPVHMGMTQPEVEAALGVALHPDEGDFESCHDTGAIDPKALPNLGFMFEDGKLTRISLHKEEDDSWPHSSVVTEKGIGVGASEADVRTAYGASLVVETAEYDAEPAHSLTHWVVPEESGIRFVTNQAGRVYVIHAGTPSIQYIEGCA